MKKEPMRSENPRQSHLLNVANLYVPFIAWTTLFLGLFVGGGFVGDDIVDPFIADTLVGTAGFFASLAFIAGCARLVEYRRVLCYLRQHGVLSYFNIYVDALYAQLKATRGRRKVLAAALTTIRRPAYQPQVLNTFTTKRMPRYLPISWAWWVATLSPARIR